VRPLEHFVNFSKIFGRDTDAIVLHKSASRDQDVCRQFVFRGKISEMIQGIGEQGLEVRSFLRRLTRLLNNNLLTFIKYIYK
jgi:hypothetical protein